MKISLLMDVEDPIDPISDDAAKTCAGILTDVGVGGTFMVVGEKARMLMQRGRADVIDALKPHSIGLHSNTHSIHPILLEYMQGLSWDDSVEEAVRHEGAGADAIARAFGREPCAWGGPGNLWGPQITAACARLGIPSVVYTHTRLRNHDVHRFLGVIHYPHGLNMSDAEYSFRDKVDARLAWLTDELRKRIDAGVTWTEVFLGHPSRIYHEEFWDAPFFEGAMPSRDQWPYSPRKDPATLDEAVRNFRYAVEYISSLQDITIIKLDEANTFFESVAPEPVAQDEIEEFWPETEGILRSMPGWPPMPSDFDMSLFVQYTRERLHTLRRLRP